jgi:replicative DNA helicase
LKREKIILDQEKNIITYMIVSTDFLKEIAGIINFNLFESDYAKEVSRWVLEYYLQYKEAPKREIENIYKLKAEKLQENIAENIFIFLSALSERWEDKQLQNKNFNIKLALKYFREQSLKKLVKDIELQLNLKKIDNAENLISDFKKIKKIDLDVVDFFKDYKRIQKAFTDEQEKMFKFPGALGECVGDFLRGDLSAFAGAIKRGKSWWLWYSSQIAAKNGWNVLYISLEMPLNQVIKRAYISQVKKSDTLEEFLYPYFENQEDDNDCAICTKIIKKSLIKVSEMKNALKQLRVKYRKGNIKLTSLPAGSDIASIISVLDNLYNYNNFCVDVVVIDYADLLSSKEKEYRHKIDDIWKNLRALAQQRDIHIITATQGNRNSFNGNIGENSIAEDYRKLAHVSKMIGINRDITDKENKSVRINQIVDRNVESMKEATVLQCLEIGQVCITSRFRKEKKEKNT